MTALFRWTAVTAAAVALAGCSRTDSPRASGADAADATAVDRPADTVALDGPLDATSIEIPAGNDAATDGADGMVEVAPTDAPATCTGCGPLEQCASVGLCVARLVPVPVGFSIDATEVTRGQYAAWLATSPSSAGQDGRCAGHIGFAPDTACMALPSVCKGEGCAQHPQPCVDFCDATAYCRAVGKRLCGARAGRPPLSDYWMRSSPADSQWYNACSSDGWQNLPVVYGRCNDYTALRNTTVPVGSQRDCQSKIDGYGGIFDLIGNLEEWEDSCTPNRLFPNEPDICYPRGLPFGMGAAAATCEASRYAAPLETSDELGFRCCAD